jgi:putative nucleotidyltransferase with HDIG domain
MTRPLSKAPLANIRPTPEAAGNRLSAAFDSFETFPALRKSRDAALLEIAGDDRSELVRIVESDPALTVAVLRADGRLAPRDRPTAVHPAVARLSPEALRLAVSSVPVFDFFDQSRTWSGIAERLRVHAQASQAAVEYVRGALEMGPRPELLAAALLHDIGKLVLAHAYPGYPRHIHGNARTPEERVQQERRELGVDHAVVGGVLARRWGLPGRLATAIERHHAEETTPEAAIVRLGDMLAHYGHGFPVDPKQLSAVARSLDLTMDQLRSVMYELPYPNGESRSVEPCPLSTREVEVLRRLRDGKVYKQIALELGLSTSTVRTHLHNTYAKLGAVDRAQAVLIATQRGWV